MANLAVHMGLSKTLRYTVGAGVISTIAFAMWLVFVERRDTRSLVEASIARQSAQIARFHQEFLADQRFASSLSVFANRAGNRDAGPILGPRVQWLGTRAPDPRGRAAAPKDALANPLYASLTQNLDNDWLSIDPGLLGGLDFGWMALLSECDYWDLDTGGDGGADIQPPMPGPELVNWAKLRLIRGIYDGKPVEALQDVEQLARLYATTESIITVEQSMVLVALADRARTQLLVQGWSADALGKPLGADARARVRRALRGAMAYADLATPASYMNDWDQIAVGRCAALAHGLAVALVSRPLLIRPHERDYEHLGRLLAASPECRLRRLRNLWAHPDLVKTTTPCGKWYERLLGRWTPSACALEGELAVTMARQGWLEQYEQKVIQ